MAVWHLKELREALDRRGWRFLGELEGDDYAISATWEFVRDPDDGSIFIDFNGLDDLKTLPIDQSYGCNVRGKEHMGLYFGKKGTTDSTSRVKWKAELHEFVTKLDHNKNAAQDNSK